MNNPWQILNLQRETATEKDVKSAYARLLKLHRPDQDPEGFHRVRGAYELAMSWLRREAEGARPSESPSLTPRALEERPSPDTVLNPAPPPHEPAFPAPLFFDPKEGGQQWRAAVEHLKETLATGDQHQPWILASHLATTARDLNISAAALEEALLYASGGDPTKLYLIMSDGLLEQLIIGQRLGLVAKCLVGWQEASDIPRLTALAQILVSVSRRTPDAKQPEPNDQRSVLDRVLQQASPEARDNGTAQISAHLANLIAFWRPDVANELANLAFPHLSPDSRSAVMTQIEQAISLGRLFERFPPNIKRFWFERLQHPRAPHDWTTSESKACLDHVFECRLYGWPGESLIRALVPEDVWEARSRRFADKRRAQGFSGRRGPFAPNGLPVRPSTPISYQTQTSSGSAPSRGLIWLGICLLFNIFRFIVNNDSGSSRSWEASRFTREAQFSFQQEAQRLKEEEQLRRKPSTSLRATPAIPRKDAKQEQERANKTLDEMFSDPILSPQHPTPLRATSPDPLQPRGTERFKPFGAAPSSPTLPDLPPPSNPVKPAH